MNAPETWFCSGCTKTEAHSCGVAFLKCSPSGLHNTALHCFALHCIAILSNAHSHGACDLLAVCISRTTRDAQHAVSLVGRQISGTWDVIFALFFTERFAPDEGSIELRCDLAVVFEHDVAMFAFDV